MNVMLLHPAAPHATTENPAGRAAESIPAGGGHAVPQSYYPPDYKPAAGTNWIELAAMQVHLEGARGLIADRLGLDPYGREAWLALPSDPREWRRADTYGRIGMLKAWLMQECNAAGERAITPVDIGPVSTIGD